MTTNLDSRRWGYLGLSTLLLICTGSIYAFSVLSGPLAELRGWSSEQVAVGFTINTAIAPIPMILGGKIVDRGWARACMTSGALLFALAFIFGSKATGLTEFYLSYGLMGGLGTGLAYSGALGNVTRFFPDRRGLATGVLMAGNGAAALLTAPLAGALIASVGVERAWLTLGEGFWIMALIVGGLVRSAPSDYRPAGWVPANRNVAGAVRQLSWPEMIRDRHFYLLLFILATGALSGLMVAANASQIGQRMYHLSVSEAALYVGLYAAGSACGRLAWGAISDRIGRPQALICIFALVAFMLLTLAKGPTTTLVFSFGFIGIGLSFGGLMGVFPALVAERFGQQNFGVNYGVLFVGYSLAASVGPKLGASLGASNQGNYSSAFMLALCVCLPGLFACWRLKKISKH
jgi:OFA family oxalate/formate antiporter-like MFS transporter